MPVYVQSPIQPTGPFKVVDLSNIGGAYIKTISWNGAAYDVVAQAADGSEITFTITGGSGGGGGGGLGVSDAHIAQVAVGEIADWAETGNVAPIPADKLTLAPQVSGLNQSQVETLITDGVRAWARETGSVIAIPAEFLVNAPGSADDGVDGRYQVTLYQVAASKPDKPTAGYDGLNFSNRGSWHTPQGIPSSIPQGMFLWASVATWTPGSPTGSLGAWSEVFPIGAGGNQASGEGTTTTTTTAVTRTTLFDGAQSTPIHHWRNWTTANSRLFRVHLPSDWSWEDRRNDLFSFRFRETDGPDQVYNVWGEDIYLIDPSALTGDPAATSGSDQLSGDPNANGGTVSDALFQAQIEGHSIVWKVSEHLSGDQSFGHGVIYLVRGASDNEIYIFFEDRATFNKYGLVTQYAFASNTVVAAVKAPAAWAESGNTDDIPGAKLGNSAGGVIASTSADVSALQLGGVYWAVKEQALYRLEEDDSRAANDYPLRASNIGLQDLSDTDNHVVRGLALEEFPPLVDVTSEVPDGDLALTPGATGTYKEGVKAVVWLSNATGSLGNLVVGMDANSTFEPLTIRIKVGSHTHSWSTLHAVQAINGVIIYYAGHGYSKAFANSEVFHLAEGQSTLTFDFDLLDAEGNSFIAPGNPARRLIKLPISTPEAPTEPTDGAGGVSFVNPYGGADMPRATPRHTLVDSETGDDYFAKTVPATDDRFVEPIQQGGGGYGFSGATPKGLSVETDGFTSFVYDADKREAAVGMSSAKLATLKQVAYYDSKRPDEVQTGDKKVFTAVPVPAAHPQEALIKRVAFKTIGSGAGKSVPVESGPNVQVSGNTVKRYVGDGLTGFQTGDVLHLDRFSRKLRAEIRSDDHQDRSQKIVGVAMKFDYTGGVLKFESGIGTSAATEGNWIDPYSPPILKAHIRMTGTDAQRLNDSYVELPWSFRNNGLTHPCLALVIAINIEQKAGTAAGTPPTVQNIEPYSSILPAAPRIWRLEHDLAGTNNVSRNIWANRYKFRRIQVGNNQTPLPWQGGSNAIEHGEVTNWCYVSVIEYNVATESDWFKCMVPNVYKDIEVEGVKVPISIQDVVGDNNSDGLGSDWKYKYESGEFDSSQDEIFKAGEERKVNLVTDLNVYHADFDATEHEFPSFHAARIRLEDSAGDSILPSEKNQGYWKLRGRAIEPDESERLDPPHEHQQLLFYDNAFWRAQIRTVNGIVFTLHADPLTEHSGVLQYGGAGLSRRFIGPVKDFAEAGWIDKVSMTRPHDVVDQTLYIEFTGDFREHYDDVTFEVTRFRDGRVERVTGVDAGRALSNPHGRAYFYWTMQLNNRDYEDGEQIMITIYDANGNRVTQTHRALVWFKT